MFLKSKIRFQSALYKITKNCKIYNFDKIDKSPVRINHSCGKCELHLCILCEIIILRERGTKPIVHSFILVILQWLVYINFFFYRFTAHLGLEIYTLFVQYYSASCRPSDHTVGRPQAENRTRDGRSRGKDSNH